MFPLILTVLNGDLGVSPKIGLFLLVCLFVCVFVCFFFCF